MKHELTPEEIAMMEKARRDAVVVDAALKEATRNIPSASSLVTEAISAVENIKGELFDRHGEHVMNVLGGDFPLGVESDGLNALVKCFGVTVWCSTDDVRPVSNDTGDYITLERFLRDKFNELASFIGNLGVQEL